MYFYTVSDFLHMGGYAIYVWPAYSIVLFVLVFNVVVAVKQKKKISRKLQRDLSDLKRLNRSSELDTLSILE